MYSYVIESLFIAGSATSSSAASRLSSPSDTSDEQAQRPTRAAAVAAAAGPDDMVYNNAEADHSDTAILPYDPAGDADLHFSSRSMGPAGEQDYKASNQAQAAADAAPGERPPFFGHSSAARPNTAAPSRPLADKTWLGTSSLSSTPPLAHDAGLAVRNQVSSAQPADLCQSNRSAAKASIASRQSNYSNSSSSLQDNSTALHTASTSSSGSYTKADSMVSKACSSPRQRGINTRHAQHQSQQDAPQLPAKAGILPISGELRPANGQPAPPADSLALAASQVCALALIFTDLKDTLMLRQRAKICCCI